MNSVNDNSLAKIIQISAVVLPCVMVGGNMTRESFDVENNGTFQHFHYFEAKKGSKIPITSQVGFAAVVLLAALLQTRRGIKQNNSRHLNASILTLNHFRVRSHQVWRNTPRCYWKG